MQYFYPEKKQNKFFFNKKNNRNFAGAMALAF